MLQPEITPYGDNAFDDPPEFDGMLYRYTGAEHIATEVGALSVFARFSTYLEPNLVTVAYERIFGVAAVVEADPIVPPTCENDDEWQTISIATDGPRAKILVHSSNLVIGWIELDQPFYDRPESIERVTVWQQGTGFDIRHEQFIAETASSSVKADLERTLGHLIV